MLKFRLFCFIHKFCFLFGNSWLPVYFKPYLINLFLVLLQFLVRPGRFDRIRIRPKMFGYDYVTRAGDVVSMVQYYYNVTKIFRASIRVSPRKKKCRPKSGCNTEPEVMEKKILEVEICFSSS